MRGTNRKHFGALSSPRPWLQPSCGFPQCDTLFVYFKKPHCPGKEQDVYLWEHQCPLKSICRFGDATIFTCDVIMVPVATCLPNITDMWSSKFTPKPLVYIDPRIPLDQYTCILDEKISDWESSDIFWILVYFQMFHVYFVNQCLTIWGTTVSLIIW